MLVQSRRSRFVKAGRLWPCLLAMTACTTVDPLMAPDAPQGSSNPDAAAGSPDADAGAGQPDAGDTTVGFSCTTATLFAGDPLFDDPAAQPVEGQGILEDPPFSFRNIIFLDGQIITHTDQSIWRVDADGKLHKIAGDQTAQQGLVTGACDQARFANIYGLALTSDGSLFISDQTGNTILKMTDPLAATCSVSHYAGTPTDIAPGDVDAGDPPNQGNDDGPGATATFRGPERIALDASDNIYVWDEGNRSIRRIASDTDHSVLTIATDVSEDGELGATPIVLGGKVYLYGGAGGPHMISVDLTAPFPKKDVFRGRADLFGGSSSDASSFGGITTDGVGIILMFKGQIFYVKADHTIVLPALAGVYQSGFDFSDGYDPKAMHSAATMEIPPSSSALSAGADGFLAIDSSKNLYISSTYAAMNEPFVEKLTCH